MSLDWIEVQVSDNQTALAVDAEQLERTVRHVLADAGRTIGTVSVAVLDNRAIRQLEKEYLNRAESTDVLSFDLGDGEELDCEVIINAQQAGEVAGERSGDPLAELNLYLVHGLLHQLGYDDRSGKQAENIHAKEDQLLGQLGFGKVFYFQREGVIDCGRG